MAWTSRLTSVVKLNGNVVPTVEFTNGTDTITRQFQADNIDAAALAAICKRVIASLDARDAAFATHAPGPIALPPDDAAVSARDLFFQRLETLKSMEAAVARGWVAPTATPFVNLKNVLSSTFLPGYATDPRMRG